MSPRVHRALVHLLLSIVVCNGVAMLVRLVALQYASLSPPPPVVTSCTFEAPASDGGAAGPALGARRPQDHTAKAALDGSGRCAVHHQPLYRALVPIVYGLRPGVPGAWEEEQRYYPNAGLDVSGGCGVGEDREAVVLHCADCLRARAVSKVHRKR